MVSTVASGARAPTALAVIADLPYPLRDGNDRRYGQNLRLLRELGYDVRVVSGVARRDGDQAGVGPHARLARAVAVTDSGRTAGARARRLSAIAWGMTRRPPVGPSAYEHRRAGLDETVMALAEEMRPRVVLLRSLFSHLAPALRRCSRRVIVDAHDAEALQALHGTRSASPQARAGMALRVMAARAAERTLNSADEVWTPSDLEASYFKARGVTPPAVVVPNGIDAVPADPPVRRPQRNLLLVAGYGYPPNCAAARFLVDEVWPRVRAHHPETSVTLVGRDLPEHLQSAWRRRGVEYHGVVEDLRPFYRAAAAVVFFPSWSTGTPLKVAEALAAGIPIVSNSTATKGLKVVHGREVLLAEDPEGAACEVVRLLDDPLLGERLALHGWRFAREWLAFDAIAGRVRQESLLGELAPEPAKP